VYNSVGQSWIVHEINQFWSDKPKRSCHHGSQTQGHACAMCKQDIFGVHIGCTSSVSISGAKPTDILGGLMLFYNRHDPHKGRNKQRKAPLSLIILRSGPWYLNLSCLQPYQSADLCPQTSCFVCRRTILDPKLCNEPNMALSPNLQRYQHHPSHPNLSVPIDRCQLLNVPRRTSS